MKTRILSLLLCVLMLVSMIPVSVSAAENVAKIGETEYPTLAEAITKAEDGDIIKLLTNITLTNDDIVMAGSHQVMANVEGKNITLDMNEKKITVNYTGEAQLVAVIRVADGAGLTVTGNGSIDIPSNGINVVYMFWKAGTTGYLTIENGTYHMEDTASSMVYTNGHEIVTVKGGTWTLDSVNTRGESNEPWIFNVQGAGDHSIIITGGSFNADINRQKWSNEAVVAKDHYVIEENGYWTVYEGAVAYVFEGMLTGPFFAPKDVGYSTFAEAVAAAKAKNDSPITLLKDITITEDIDMSGTQVNQNSCQITLTPDCTVISDNELEITAANGYKVVTANDNGKYTYRTAVDSFTIWFRNWTKEGNLGNGSIKKTATVGEPLTVPTLSENRAGYSYNWNNYRNGTGAYTYAPGAVIPAEDIAAMYGARNAENTFNMNAVWVPNTDTPYKVQHIRMNVAGDKQDGAFGTYDAYGTTDALSTATAKNFEGYTAILPIEQLPVKADGSTLVKIYYKKNTYKLTFDANGGNFADGAKTVVNDKAAYNSTVTAPAEPTRKGYTFAGWGTYPAKMPAGDLTVKAMWTANEYTVTYDPDNGIHNPLTKKIKYNTKFTLMSAPPRSGYTFMGWAYDGQTFNAGQKIIYKYAKNITLTAQWAANDGSVVFNPNGGTGKAFTLPRTTDESFTMPENSFTKVGYTFVGWCAFADGKNADGTDAEIYAPGQKITYTVTNKKALVLYAIWSPNTYTITYKVDGEVYKTYSFKCDETIAVDVTAPTKVGSTFGGWDKTLPATMPAENLVLNAIWGINNYSIKFMDGTTVLSEATLAYGAAVTAPAAPTKEGFTFAGWVDAEGAAATIPATMPAANVTLYASWDEVIVPEAPKSEPVFDNILFALVARYSQRYTVEVVAENATVTGDTTIKYKRSGSVEIAPAEGYVIVDVIVNGVSLGAVDKVDFKQVKANQSLVVITKPVCPYDDADLTRGVLLAHLGELAAVDVSYYDAEAPYVAWAIEAELITVAEDGSFAADELPTFEEAAQLFTAFAAYMGIEADLSAAETVGEMLVILTDLLSVE